MTKEDTRFWPFFCVNVILTFSPTFTDSASIPSGSTKTLPSFRVIESDFVFTLRTVPVVSAACALVARTRPIAVTANRSLRIVHYSELRRLNQNTLLDCDRIALIGPDQRGEAMCFMACAAKAPREHYGFV